MLEFFGRKKRRLVYNRSNKPETVLTRISHKPFGRAGHFVLPDVEEKSDKEGS